MISEKSFDVPRMLNAFDVVTHRDLKRTLKMVWNKVLRRNNF